MEVPMKTVSEQKSFTLVLAEGRGTQAACAFEERTLAGEG